MKYPAGFLRPLNRRGAAAGRLIGPAGFRWLPRAALIFHRRAKIISIHAGARPGLVLKRE
jgi:hypothetical protein